MAQKGKLNGILEDDNQVKQKNTFEAAEKNFFRNFHEDIFIIASRLPKKKNFSDTLNTHFP